MDLGGSFNWIGDALDWVSDTLDFIGGLGTMLIIAYLIVGLVGLGIIKVVLDFKAGEEVKLAIYIHSAQDLHNN